MTKLTAPPVILDAVRELCGRRSNQGGELMAAVSEGAEITTREALGKFMTELSLANIEMLEMARRGDNDPEQLHADIDTIQITRAQLRNWKSVEDKMGDVIKEAAGSFPNGFSSDQVREAMAISLAA